MDNFKVPELVPSGEYIIQSTLQELKSDVIEQKQVTQILQNANTQSCPYKTPKWSAAPSSDVEYKFEVLKSGQIIDIIKDIQKQATWKFGRLSENDIEMAHPTISRFHAILQYRPKLRQSSEDDKGDNEKDKNPDGWYIYDLHSTHGTFLNKQRIPPRVYIRMRVGHMLRLGASTRSYILQGPVEDEEPELELSVTELREQRVRIREDAERISEAEERTHNEGISWGMTEDADEESDLAHNPYAITNNEQLFLDDPKRTLRGYFEREGLQLDYKCDEMSAGSFVCRVELPLDDMHGRPVVAEVVHKGKKKECVVQCALEACRILDRHGVLRQANQEPLKRKLKTMESDSDDDEFWDRTGDIERKKLRKTLSAQNVTVTYDDLLKQETKLSDEMCKVENHISKYQESMNKYKAAKEQQGTDEDDLDDYMKNLNADVTKLDKIEIRKLRLEQQRIKAEQQRVQRLLKIAKPIELPFAKINDGVSSDTVAPMQKKQLAIIGKRNQFSKFKIVGTQKNVKCNHKTLVSDEEEVEDDDEEFSKELKRDEAIKHAKEESHLPNEAHIEKKPESEEIASTSKSKAKEMCDSYIIHKQNLDSKLPGDTTVENLPTESNMNESFSNTFINEQVENAEKKRRQRSRHRNRRHEVDIHELEKHEEEEKYAKWVPPENQSGDGYTKLNEKYGY